MTARQVIKSILPPHSKRRKIAKKLALDLRIIASRHPDPKYLAWLVQTESGLWDRKTEIIFQPKFSVVVPAFNTPDKYLLPMVYSVVNQTYDHWELVIANASDKQDRKLAVARLAEIDERIKIIDLSKNLGIAKNTNTAIDAATGDYIVFLDHDDTLAPQALRETVCALQGEEKPQLIYSDEDKLSDDGQFRYDPHFKPDWSPDLLYQLNYITHLTIVESSLLNKAEGLRDGVEGAQDYDLLLRLLEQNPRIHHIEKILYHWRSIRGSTAQDFSSKSYVLESGIKALKDHFSKQNIAADVNAMPGKPGFYKTSYEVPDSTKVSIIIAPGGSASAFTYFVRSMVEQISDKKLSIELIVSEKVFIREWVICDVPIKIISSRNTQEFFKNALIEAQGNIIVCYTAAVLPRSDDWLEELVGVALQKHVSAVAPIIFNRHQNRIFDSGIVYKGNIPYKLFENQKMAKHTYFGDTDWVRDVSHVSGLLFATKKEIFSTAFNSKKMIEGGIISSVFLKALSGDNEYQVIWPFVEAEISGIFLLPNYATGYKKYLNSNVISFSKNQQLPVGFNQEYNAQYNGEIQ